MVIDSSAILAVIFEEREALRLSSAIASDRSRLISTVNLVESLIVIESRKGRPWVATATALMEGWGIHPIPFDGEHISEAQRAWRRFGKGRHAAALNMADCAAYATATIAGEPLLFKGHDFAKTDVPRVEWK